MMKATLIMWYMEIMSESNCLFFENNVLGFIYLLYSMEILCPVAIFVLSSILNWIYKIKF